MKKAILLLLILLSLFGCDNKTIKLSHYEAEIENTSEKAKIFDINKNSFLLVIEGNKHEAYYINIRDKIFSISSLSKYEYSENKHKAIVNKSALRIPPFFGIFDEDFKIVNDSIEIYVKQHLFGNPIIDGKEDKNYYARYLSVYQKKIIFRKKY